MVVSPFEAGGYRYLLLCGSGGFHWGEYQLACVGTGRDEWHEPEYAGPIGYALLGRFDGGPYRLEHVQQDISPGTTDGGNFVCGGFTIVAILANNLWVLVAVGLFHSVMWGCIFTLAIQGLKKYTSKASGVFMMGVFGGAVFPVLQGALADVLGSWRWTWGIVVVCELVMLYYAQVGSRVKEED